MGLIFLGDDRVTVGDITLRYTPSGAGGTPDAPVLVKDRAFIETYQEILLPHAPRRMLEFGIGEGGSALFHTELLWPRSVRGRGHLRTLPRLRGAAGATAPAGAHPAGTGPRPRTTPRGCA